MNKKYKESGKQDSKKQGKVGKNKEIFSNIVNMSTNKTI